VRTPFATLGITTTDTHVTGIRFLAPSIAARRRRGTLAYLACVQLQAYLDEPALRLRPAAALAGTHHRSRCGKRCSASRGQDAHLRRARARARSSRAPWAALAARTRSRRRALPSRHRAPRDIGGFMGRREEGFERSIKRWLLEHEGAL
jgi:methylated-DNA-[protein]-cysteine S-methyltransferase